MLDGGIEIRSLERNDRDGFIEAAEDFDVLIGARVPAEYLDSAPNLRYYIVPFAGIPQKDREVLAGYPRLTVLNSHFNARFTAEHAWALLLASAKKICPVHEKMKKGDWSIRFADGWNSLTLAGKTVLILGYGHIGRYAGRFAKAFGMKVIGVKKNPADDGTADLLETPERLDLVLPEADFIVVSLPATEQTEGFLSDGEFALMKDGVHIVNVARGNIIDEKAFYESLESGKTGGAAIDTWWVYPESREARSGTFPSNFPLDKFGNVIFSPHRASHVMEFEQARMEDLARILNSIKRNDPVNIVNIERGY